MAVARLGSRTRGRRPDPVIVVAVLVGMWVAVAAVGWSRPATLEPAAPAPAALTAAEADFYDYVAPRLAALVREGRELAALGDRRSRNLLAIQRGQRRVEALLDEVDAYGTATVVPPRFAAALTAYDGAATDLRASIAAARQGVVGFDWAAVGRATVAFGAAVEAMSRAAALLDTGAGFDVGPPVATGTALPAGDR